MEMGHYSSVQLHPVAHISHQSHVCLCLFCFAGFITSTPKHMCNGTLIIRRAVMHIGTTTNANGDTDVDMSAPRARYVRVPVWVV